MPALSSLPPGIAATIESLDSPTAVRRRLLELGLTPGSRVCVVRRALFGDPIELRIRGYLLSLRREQADLVHAVPSEPSA